jgi:hypothetical protein
MLAARMFLICWRWTAGARCWWRRRPCSGSDTAWHTASCTEQACWRRIERYTSLFRFHSSLFLMQRLFIVGALPEHAERRRFVWPDDSKDLGFTWKGALFVCGFVELFKQAHLSRARYSRRERQRRAATDGGAGRRNAQHTAGAFVFVLSSSSFPPSLVVQVKADGKLRTLMASYKRSHRLHSQFVPLREGGGYRFFSPRECARAQGFGAFFKLDACNNQNSV